MPFQFIGRAGETITLDESNAAPGMQALQTYVQTCEAAAVAPIQTRLDAVVTDLAASNVALVAEIVRRRRLANAKLNVESETTHLATFNTTQLVAELGRTVDLLKADPQGSATKNVDNPKDPAGVQKLDAPVDNPYMPKQAVKAA